MSVKVTLNKRRVLKRITSGADNARAMLTEQVYQDSDEYTPHDNGDLKKTARIDPKNGTITYTKPYAKKLWNGIDYNFSKDKSAKATHEWCDAAKKDHNKDWQKVAQQAFKEGMK